MLHAACSLVALSKLAALWLGVKCFANPALHARMHGVKARAFKRLVRMQSWTSQQQPVLRFKCDPGAAVRVGPGQGASARLLAWAWALALCQRQLVRSAGIVPPWHALHCKPGRSCMLPGC